MFLEMSFNIQGRKSGARIPPFTADNKAKCRISLPLIHIWTPQLLQAKFSIF